MRLKRVCGPRRKSRVHTEVKDKGPERIMPGAGLGRRRGVARRRRGGQVRGVARYGVGPGRGVVRWRGCGHAEEGFEKSQPHGDGLHHIFFF